MVRFASTRCTAAGCCHPVAHVALLCLINIGRPAAAACCPYTLAVLLPATPLHKHLLLTKPLPTTCGCADSGALEEEEEAAAAVPLETLESGRALWRDFFSVAPITTTAGAVTSTSLDFIAP